MGADRTREGRKANVCSQPETAFRRVPAGLLAAADGGGEGCADGEGSSTSGAHRKAGPASMSSHLTALTVTASSRPRSSQAEPVARAMAKPSHFPGVCFWPRDLSAKTWSAVTA